MNVQFTNDGIIKNMTFKEWMKNKQEVNSNADAE